MTTRLFKGKPYEVDVLGFLVDPTQWDEVFADGMAPEVDIPQGLTEDHWKVIRFLRNANEETGRLPTVYQACKSNGLRIGDLMRLFPSGYRRGAVKLSGYSEGYYNKSRQVQEEKVYRMNAHGFLVDPLEWDEGYAVGKADELGLPEGLTSRHWQVIRFLRERFNQTGLIPNVYETCEANHLELEELESLFPSGYHRGAVKIAGLHLAEPKA